MTQGDSGSAGAAFDAVRAAVTRLQIARHPEDQAADLLDGWSAVERLLRARLEGAGGSGMALVREARQQQRLSFEQANALAGFAAAADRARDTAYQPSVADVDAARRALAALERSAPGAAAPAEEPAPAPVPPATPPGASPALPPLPSIDEMTPNGLRRTPLGGFETVADAAHAARRRRWFAVAALFAAGVLGGALYYWFGGPRRSAVMRQAMALYEAGNLDSAAAVFRRVVLIDPAYPLSHVYLARIARREGNLATANVELQLAITADPTDAIALREMGAYLFTTGNFELARKFYVRAVEADPLDAASQGYLGCALVRLGRIDEGERWITRAGPGAWTACVSGATPPDTLH
ncbi:MAG: tetratricopeptide repeat protein [Gemmatimonadota bacterium]|nr:tetratricopeptide repeat protein [Gemmatimonadota bacterium]